MNKMNLLGFYNRLKSRERVFLLGALTVILLLMSDVVILRPLWSYMISLNERALVQEKKLIRNLLNINRKERVEMEFEEHRHLIQHPGTDEEEIGKMLSEIEQKARNNNVILVDMKPHDPRSLEYYKVYWTEVDTEMRMNDWIKFVHEVEESNQLIRLTTATLRLKEGDETIARARMEFTKTLILDKSP